MSNHISPCSYIIYSPFQKSLHNFSRFLNEDLAFRLARSATSHVSFDSYLKRLESEVSHILINYQLLSGQPKKITPFKKIDFLISSMNYAMN